ncbi:MAG: hypothetical protein P4L73_07360 [Caulobacteraceae bacterium]|nr:hypothetical protein [Caulobacteraceae bacterium]
MTESAWYDAAAWVQAIGTIGAVIGAAWVAASDSRAARRREEQVRQEMHRREEMSRREAKTAALNLAILASTQIHELYGLLRDEARRGRVERISPSRTLLATERLLIAFPIQSLADAAAMVAFSYFPGALANAAEIFANLETAVRSSDDDKHGEVFADYSRQLALLDEAIKRRLRELRTALHLAEASAGAASGQPPPPDAPGGFETTRAAL